MSGCGVGVGGVSETPGENQRVCEADCRCLTGPEICRLIRVHGSVDSGAADGDYHSVWSPFMHVSAA